MMAVASKSVKKGHVYRNGQIALRANISDFPLHISTFAEEANKNRKSRKEFVANYICNVGPGTLKYEFSFSNEGMLTYNFSHALKDIKVTTNFITCQIIQTMIAQSIQCSQPLTQCRASWKSSGYDIMTLELDMSTIQVDDSFQLEINLSDLKVCYESAVGPIVLQPLVSFIHRKPKTAKDGLGAFIFEFREHLSEENQVCMNNPKLPQDSHSKKIKQNKQKRLRPYQQQLMPY